MLNWLWVRREQWLWAPIAFVGTLVLIGLVSFAFNIPGDICQPAEQGGKPDCDHYNLAFAVLWQIAKFFDATSVFVTAAATALLTVVTFYLWQLERDGDKTTRAQLRAYIFVTGMSFERGPKQDVVKVTVKNFGVTPAYDVQLYCGLGWSNDAKMSAYPMDDIVGPKAAIGPGYEQSLFAFTVPPLPDFVIQEAEAGRFFIHLWGEVRYRTAFTRESPTVPRNITQFRCTLRYRKVGDPNFEHNIEGNGAD